MAYELTSETSADLRRIYRTSAETFGVAQAESYIAGFGKTFDLLAAFPGAARVCAEFDPPIRAHPYRSHLVLYLTRDDDILIVRIRHARENWSGSD